MNLKINQFEIWLADLNPQIGTEPGKTRPVVIVQTNLLNKILHPSTIILPIKTNVISNTEILRININKGISNLNYDCDIMLDQIRSIDNNRLIKKIGVLPKNLIQKIIENLKIILTIP